METEKETWHEYLPANARVVVDYNKPPQEKVKFTYPKEWTWKGATEHIIFPTMFAWWMIIGIFEIFVLVATTIGFYIGILITQPFFRTVLYYAMFPPKVIKPSAGHNLIPIINHIPITVAGIASAMPMTIFCITFLLMPFICTWYFYKHKEEVGKFFPKINYSMHQLLSLGHDRKIIEAKPEDIVDNIFVIPRFSNVYLDYVVKGDFARYLQRIEVMEYPYNYTYEKSQRKVINQYVWRTVFRFERKPETGSLKVIYV